MRVFVTGASGLTGPAVVCELIAAGHIVTALARSDNAAARLQALGVSPRRGSLEDLDSLHSGAEQADGVLYMAFGGDCSDPGSLIRRDRTAIETLGQALLGSSKPLVSTSGTLVMPAGRVSTDQDTVRLAPTVHGPGDYGFIAALVVTARKTGISAHVGDGSNRWPAIHRLDAASLAHALAIPARSLTPDEAASHFESPFLAAAYGVDAPVSSARTQALLGWAPTHATLLEDLETGDYFTETGS